MTCTLVGTTARPDEKELNVQGMQKDQKLPVKFHYNEHSERRED